jgi:hypothetical protein
MGGELMNKNKATEIKKVIIEITPSIGVDFHDDVFEMNEKDFIDSVTDSIADLVYKGVAYFAENVDKISIINDKGEKRNIDGGKWYYG